MEFDGFVIGFTCHKDFKLLVSTVQMTLKTSLTRVEGPSIKRQTA